MTVDGEACSLTGTIYAQPLREMNNSVSPRGEGNVVSVEFNLMYRWHSTLSEPDTAWIQQKFQSMIGGRDFSQVRVSLVSLVGFPSEHLQLNREELKTLYHAAKPPSDVSSWTFGGYAHCQIAPPLPC